MMTLTRRNLLKYGLTAGALGMVSRNYAQSSETSLITKVIPSTGERLPIIGFGTNRYGSGSEPEVRAVLLETLKVFKDLGATLLDTSSHYRGSEVVLGSLLAELDLNDKAFLATKCGQFDDGDLATKMNNSLEHVGVDSLDLYQIHNVVNQDWQNMLPALREWKQEGKIRYIGITGSEDIEHEQIIEIMRTQPLDFVQINYNLISRNAEQELLPLAKERGIAVVGNVPFAQGELFAAVSGLELPEFAKEFCQSWGNFFLKYNVSHPEVMACIPGTSKPHHAVDNLNAAMGRLPSAAERKMQEDFIASI